MKSRPVIEQSQEKVSNEARVQVQKEQTYNVSREIWLGSCQLLRSEGVGLPLG